MKQTNWLFTVVVSGSLAVLLFFGSQSANLQAQEDGGFTEVGGEGDIIAYRSVLANELNIPMEEIVLPPVCQLPLSDALALNDHNAHSYETVTANLGIGKDSVGFAANTGDANIDVIYNGSWTEEAITAFEFAVSIWEDRIFSDVTIVIDAEYSNLGGNILGAAGPFDFFYTTGGTTFPQINTYYPAALADALAGTDVDPGNPDIVARFNSEFDWYLGTDGNTPFNQVDFVSVVLHEIGHGLGFSGSMQTNGTLGAYGIYSFEAPIQPFIYDRFAQDGSSRALISYPNFSRELETALTSNAVFFSGSNTNFGNNGSRAQLYAPSNWTQGSSYSHLGESFNGTPNSLMTFAISSGTSELYPGHVTLGMFRDMGWQTISEPSFNPPSILLETNESRPNAYNLETYAFDAEDPANATFELVSVSDTNAGVTLDSNNNLDINPAAGWTGSASVVLRMTNSIGQTASDTITVSALNEINDVYAPLVFE
ncbi:MAG: hypothetical protein AAF633_26005 [Chloroflexota bacterium]